MTDKHRRLEAACLDLATLALSHVKAADAMDKQELADRLRGVIDEHVSAILRERDDDR